MERGFRAFIAIVAPQTVGCSKASEPEKRSHHDDDEDEREKPARTKSSSSSIPSSSASVSPRSAEVDDTASGHSAIPGIRAGSTLTCRDTFAGKQSSFIIVDVAIDDWVRVRSQRGDDETSRALGGPYWLRLGKYPCDLFVAVPDRH